MSEARQCARGQSASAAKASSPRAGADIGDIAEAVAAFAQPASMSRQPARRLMRAVPKARLAGISRSIAPGFARSSASCRTWNGPASIGSSPAWLCVTQSTSGTGSTVTDVRSQDGSWSRIRSISGGAGS